ncbi:MAG: alkaline phosphatase family protein, partial [Holophagales bacterium]|nr:alkaline phosphatase family protein [Holophagales bacterium]
ADESAAAMELLEGAVAADPDWLPRPLLTAALVGHYRRRGELEAALRLARRAALAYPHDPDVGLTELELRLEREDPKGVIESVARSLPERGPAAPALAIRLALRSGERREFRQADALFGTDPPRGTRPEEVTEWFRSRAAVFGMEGDAEAVARTCRRWLESGGDRSEVLAWHAVTLSLYQLEDPRRSTLALLEAAAAERSRLSDPRLLRTLYSRLVGTLIVSGRPQEARSRLDEASKMGIDLAYTPEDIRRSALPRSPGEPGADALDAEATGSGAPGLLRFLVDGAGAVGQAERKELELRLSPDAGKPVDDSYEILEGRPAVDSAGTFPWRFESERRPGPVPQRWVLWRGEAPLASGSVWPVAGEEVEVGIELGGPAPPSSPAGASLEPRSRPGDGRRRIVGVILDCADWRLLQYLRARGEMPVLGSLLGKGLRGVPWSEPAYTAAAMAAIAAPVEAPHPGVLSALHRLGSELGSNPFLGGNPVAPLAWLVPEPPSLFATVGAGPRVALNLLFAEGEVRAGRHGERIGPGGAMRPFTDWRASRPLNTEERHLFPELDAAEPEAESGPGSWQTWTESTAAVLDAAETVAGRSEIDLALVRLAAFDAATHAGFARISRGGRDDGRHPLFALYRYVDHRLAGIDRQLDADDVLIVMSDHGIRTAMQHDERCLFVAHGGGLGPGRIPGHPQLRGLPAYLARLLGLETPWPETGFPAAPGAATTEAEP